MSLSDKARELATVLRPTGRDEVDETLIALADAYDNHLSLMREAIVQIDGMSKDCADLLGVVAGWRENCDALEAENKRLRTATT